MKNHAENKLARLVSNLFFFFEKKKLDKVKASGQLLRFKIIWQILTETYNKKTL